MPPAARIVRLLSPHIRRAMAVSDVLDIQAVAVGTFEASFDLIACGVVLVDARGAIIHLPGNRFYLSIMSTIYWRG